MLEEILQQLKSANARLVAVSKTKPEAEIMRLYQQGQRLFGENRVQELVFKYEALPKDIEWHLIGHLQTNKVKYIAPFVALIHSVDSFKVLKEINKQARRCERVIDVLLQFKIAAEDTKYGFDLPEARKMLEDPAFAKMENIRITGVMGMATFTDDQEQVRREFRELRSVFESLQKEFFANEPAFREISMGMSGDYHTALEEGSTIVRIGTLLFGER